MSLQPFTFFSFNFLACGFVLVGFKNSSNNNNNNIFEPIAIDTLGVLNTSARQLLCDLGR